MYITQKLMHLISGGWKYRNGKIDNFASTCHTKRILEIGSGTTSCKQFFDESNEFVCSDYEGRHGHMKLDAASFKVKEKFDVILLMSVLEHVPDFWKVVPNCFNALNNGGMLFIFSPMFYPLHNEPEDFWRITVHGFKHLLKDFKSTEFDYKGFHKKIPFFYCVKATK